jgi:hypothetical protein
MISEPSSPLRYCCLQGKQSSKTQWLTLKIAVPSFLLLYGMAILHSTSVAKSVASILLPKDLSESECEVVAHRDTCLQRNL